MKTLFTLETIWSALRLSIPVAIAALGAILSERSGVLNLGLEGMMLTGAFGGFVVADATGNSWVGLLAGPVVGALCGALFALLVVTIRANQIVTGLAFTLLATSATTYLFDRNYDIGSARVDRIPQGALMVLLAVLLASTWYFLNRTTAGLALSAVGESPVAADALGYRVQLAGHHERRSLRWSGRCSAGVRPTRAVRAQCHQRPRLGGAGVGRVRPVAPHPLRDRRAAVRPL
jgi:ABC-type uncharacterized transport system permease subunit